jgi:tetratricopeptide (TPR) repeat protein
MAANDPVDYLARITSGQRQVLERINNRGLASLRRNLAAREAVAFLGAGVSAPLYPLWDGLINELVDMAADQMSADEAATCRRLAQQAPEEVVELVRRSLGAGYYREVLREVLRVRTDPETGRSWTPVHELICRCTFKAVVTTNYDPGIVDARMRVRGGASATGFTTWEDEWGLDRWRTGDVFGEAELPVLFAHGQHNRPDSIVLAATEYRRAYAGKLPNVLGRLADAGHLTWIGFSFGDQRVAAILKAIADQNGTSLDPGSAPRHVAIIPWDPDAPDNNPRVLAKRSEIGFGAEVILYPAPAGDHSALAVLLSSLTDPGFPPASPLPGRMPPAPNKITGDPDARAVRPVMAVRWIPEPDPVEQFTGRAEELARLDRWAADSHVRLIGITAWGGAGKTSLVTRWVSELAGTARLSRVRAVFGWSFYADPSAEHWAESLLDWASQELGIPKVTASRRAGAVLALLRATPLALILDGLEVLQEGPAGGGFGRLLDGTLREVLVSVCQQTHRGLVVLTSRFPFADLESFDGGSARMLEVPPFTHAEGSALLAASGGDWLDDTERRALVAQVDGHALAVAVLAGLLAARLPFSDLAVLQAELGAATKTSARVKRVLAFYAKRLSDSDRYFLAAISLFARPVPVAAVLALGRHDAFGGHLASWKPENVQAAVRDRLAGLASWHPDETVSAHPLIRDTFRPLVLGAAETAAESALAGLSAGEVVSPIDALRVVEVVELLLDADQWQAADNLNRARTGNGEIWKRLPSARLGERAAIAFVATSARRAACVKQLGASRTAFYLSSVGLFALYAGDMTTAQEFLPVSVSHYRSDQDIHDLAISLRNLADCRGQLGDTAEARDAATEALKAAKKANERVSVLSSHAYLGWLAGLRGDTREAETQFTAADQIEVANDPDKIHLYSVRGIWWAEWLARTGRRGPAKKLTDSNLQLCRRYKWNQDVARCRELLGRFALEEGRRAVAGRHLSAAIAAFREGDLLTELATTLVDLAEYARVTGDLEDAERHAREAINIAGPRGLILVQSAALSALARIQNSVAALSSSTESFADGRDSADAALRLATRHQLAWHELDALRAHASLDHVTDTDHGWTQRADALYARIISPRLDPDPLTTIKKRVIASHTRKQPRIILPSTQQ